ncbi:MAG: hypothetical protein R3181_13980 [Rubricoccaceae bacterium]|nr:hypothetical protein [Rubricoccaceae bacterium]
MCTRRVRRDRNSGLIPLHARTAVVDLTPGFMKGVHRLFGRDAVAIETEA